MIEFQNVSFSYENGDHAGQLHNINFTIPDARLSCSAVSQAVGKPH